MFKMDNSDPIKDNWWKKLKVIAFLACAILLVIIGRIYYSSGIENTMSHDRGELYFMDNIQYQNRSGENHTKTTTSMYSERFDNGTGTSISLPFFPFNDTTTQVIVQNQKEVMPSSPTCKVLKFIEFYKSKSSTLSASSLRLIGACKLVLYARTPKCGSRMVRDVFTELGKIHHFRTVMFGEKCFDAAVKEMNENNNFQPMTITGHRSFKNLSGIQEGKESVYVNIIRDPIEQLISMYSFQKYGSVIKDSKVPGVPEPGKPNKNAKPYSESLDLCISKHGLRFPCIIESYSALQYLCGSADGVCKSREQNEARLQIAKKHLDDYLIVGVTEDISAFFEILDVFLPKMFQGANEAYLRIRDVAYEKWKTNKKETISNDTREFLYTQMGADYELYNFVKSRLYYTLQKVRDYKKIENNNNLRSTSVIIR